MPARTMSSGQLKASGVPIPNIVYMKDKAQVIGVNASSVQALAANQAILWNMAGMVDLLICWYGALVEFVGNAMRQVCAMVSYTNNSVPILLNISGKQPASILWAYRDSSQQSFEQCKIGFRHLISSVRSVSGSSRRSNATVTRLYFSTLQP